jgi:hypothetical protein
MMKETESTMFERRLILSKTMSSLEEISKEIQPTKATISSMRNPPLQR